MTALPLKTSISDTYPNPSNATARAGFAQLWDVISEAFEKPELDLTAGTTTDVGGQGSRKLRFTGSGYSIASFGTNYTGPVLIRVAGSGTIVQNATTLVCPGATNLTVFAGDVLMTWSKSTTSGTADGWQVVRLARGVGEIALGVGQTWQSVKASRAASTTYTNSTGRPIMVSVTLVTSVASTMSVIVGGVALEGSSYSTGAGMNYATFLVPNGVTYSVANNLGTSVVSNWSELR